jgi:hypothetical protein
MKDMKRTVHVYCVCDPRCHQVKYVGQTLLEPVKHIRGYTYMSRFYARTRKPRTPSNPELMAWLRELDCVSVDPMVVTLELVPQDQVRAREALWIAYFRQCGEPLLNKLIR